MSLPVVASACLQWAENIDNLLNDTEGLKLFRSFLAQEYVTHPLDFYLACLGLRKSSATVANDQERLRMFLKSLYRKYLRSNSECFVPLSDEARKSLQNKIASLSLDGWTQEVERSQDEVKALLKRSLYQQFLKSDVYVQHLQQFFPQAELQQDARSNEQPPEQPAAPVGVVLPTLHEDAELKAEDCAVLQATPSSSFITSQTEMTEKQPQSRGLPPKCQKQLNPYFASYYAAVSTVDSDRQSLSSEDVEFQHSLTDSSISSYRLRWQERRHHRQQQNGGNSSSKKKAAGQLQQLAHFPAFENALAHPTSSTSLATRMNGSLHGGHHNHSIGSAASLRFCYPQNLPENNDALLKYQPFIPRGERPSKLSNLAQENPQEFARILTEKLEKTIVEREKEERIERCLREYASNSNDAASGDDVPSMSQSMSTNRRSSVKISTSLAKFVQSLSSEHDGDTADEHAQSILEDHMSRVWDKTLCLDSPGMNGQHQQIPPFNVFPDSHNAFSRSFHSAPQANRLPNQAAPSSRNNARKALPLQQNDILSVSSYDSGAVQPPFVPSHQPGATVFASRQHQILIDPTGHFDSGISIADTESAKSLPPLSTTAKQKVLNWMLHNDQKQSVGNCQQQQQDLMPPPSALPQQQSVQSDSDTQTKGRGSRSRSKRSNDGVETSSSSTVNNNNHHEYTTVAYKFSDEEIPYRSQLPGKNVTLRQFKQLITKRGLFRFYFKHATDEFPGGCVNEEVADDDSVLPLYDGKIFARVERIEAASSVSAAS